MVQEMKIVW